MYLNYVYKQKINERFISNTQLVVVWEALRGPFLDRPLLHIAVQKGRGEGRIRGRRRRRRRTRSRRKSAKSPFEALDWKSIDLDAKNGMLGRQCRHSFRTSLARPQYCKSAFLLRSPQQMPYVHARTQASSLHCSAIYVFFLNDNLSNRITNKSHRTSFKTHGNSDGRESFVLTGKVGRRDHLPLGGFPL